MGVHTNISDDKSTVTIFIEGDFNFSLLSDFKNSYNNNDVVTAKKIIIDLSGTLTIDSSALGMLLVLQRDMEKTGKAINVVNCNSLVRRIFAMTNLDRMFNVE